eukprot:6010083-Alexandrium_andersonii.AAC.1
MERRPERDLSTPMKRRCSIFLGRLAAEHVFCHVHQRVRSTDSVAGSENEEDRAEASHEAAEEDAGAEQDA